MPGEELNDKTILDLLLIGAYGAALAAAFQAVRALRRHPTNFDVKKFCVGLASAGCVGAIVAWLLDAFGVSRELSAAIVAMLGYTGGSLLDMIEKEVPETIQAGFDGLQKRLQEGKWKRDD